MPHIMLHFENATLWSRFLFGCNYRRARQFGGNHSSQADIQLLLDLPDSRPGQHVRPWFGSRFRRFMPPASRAMPRMWRNARHGTSRLRTVRESWSNSINMEKTNDVASRPWSNGVNMEKSGSMMQKKPAIHNLLTWDFVNRAFTFSENVPHLPFHAPRTAPFGL